MKRIFILDSSCGVAMAELIELMIKFDNPSQKAEVILHQKWHERHLPKNFDLYFIYFSDTSEEALEELREKQPWCKIILSSGVQIRKPKFVDELCYIIHDHDIKEFLALIDINFPDED